MIRNKINKEYFEWMLSLINDPDYRPRASYRRLLDYLFDIPFEYSFPHDENRADDGINLRYRFAEEFQYDSSLISVSVDITDCSILEMLVALAVRCEEHIMYDGDYGDRTGKWFWGMIFNLGLKSMDDFHFNSDFVDGIIQRFLNRHYAPDGEGGLFTIYNCDEDLRNVEIWYQLCWYLNEVIEN